MSPSYVDEFVTVARAAQDVWKAFVDDGIRRGWWAYLELEAVIGGRLEERWTDAKGRPVTTRGRVIDIAPASQLYFTWADERWSVTTEVDIRLVETRSGTVVRVRHSGWEKLADGPRLADEHRWGWRLHLDNLQRYLMESKD